MIVGVASWRGLGATSTALLLAAVRATGPAPIVADGDTGRDPVAPDSPTWLIEADPAGGVIAARTALVAPAGGLERLAFPGGPVGSPIERFGDAASALGDVRVVTAPGDPFRAWTCHTPRLAWAHSLRDLPGTVIVDVGRLRGGGPVQAVLEQLDVLLVVTSADAADIVTSATWVDALGRVSPVDRGVTVDIARVVVVETPFIALPAGRADVERDLGDRLFGWLPWSPPAVRLVEQGCRIDDRRLRRQPLVRAISAMSRRLDGIVGVAERAA
jgi:hypothetical protein